MKQTSKDTQIWKIPGSWNDGNSLPLPEVWAFGDDLNDIRMLSEVGEELRSWKTNEKKNKSGTPPWN